MYSIHPQIEEDRTWMQWRNLMVYSYELQYFETLNGSLLTTSYINY